MAPNLPREDTSGFTNTTTVTPSHTHIYTLRMPDFDPCPIILETIVNQSELDAAASQPLSNLRKWKPGTLLKAGKRVMRVSDTGHLENLRGYSKNNAFTRPKGMSKKAAKKRRAQRR